MASRHPSSATVGAWTGLVRARQALLGRVEAELRAAGFPPLAWYDVLLELRRARGEGLRPKEIESRMLLAQYNVSRLVERIVAAGYARRAPCPDDRRSSVLTITSSGRALLRSMWPRYAAAIERHVGSKLDQRELQTLNELIAKLVGPGADGG